MSGSTGDDAGESFFFTGSPFLDNYPIRWIFFSSLRALPWFVFTKVTWFTHTPPEGVSVRLSSLSLTPSQHPRTLVLEHPYR